MSHCWRLLQSPGIVSGLHGRTDDDVFKKSNKIELDEKQVKKVLTGSFIEMNKNLISATKSKNPDDQQ